MPDGGPSSELLPLPGRLATLCYIAHLYPECLQQVARRRAAQTQSVHQGRQDHRALALVFVGDPGRVVPEGLSARDTLVAADDHFPEFVIANGLGEGSMAVQVGFFAVTTGAGTVGGASVDIGDDQTNLHGLTALFSE